MKENLTQLLQSGKLTLISTHERLCFPIIVRIAKKMSIGLTFNAISVDDKLIVNGHHRYLASVLVGYKLDQIPCPKTSAKEAIDWKLVKLVDEDWDTDAKIRMLNEEDARYNDLSTDDLIRKLK
jgi:hypothetical protein